MSLNRQAHVTRTSQSLANLPPPHRVDDRSYNRDSRLQRSPMRTRALQAGTLLYLLTAFPPPAGAQVDQRRAQEFFKEAQALCERDGGRLWGVSICAPMVIGDARTQTFATSQPPPDAPRPKL